MASYVSTQNGDWNTASTWGGAGVPTIADTVTINGHDITEAALASAAKSVTMISGSLTQTHPGGGLKTFTINGSFAMVAGSYDIGSAGSPISRAQASASSPKSPD